MNEEEIRGKVLLPFLKDLGFDPSEISLEESFTIRLGKNHHIIRGRYDILCKRNNQNLFIIELKSDSIEISHDDIDQGISYARMLVGNIAPFTILTNGKSTRIFDSISRLEITDKKISEYSDFWKNGSTLSTDEELRIRYDALKKFISFSDENLRIFCTNQVQDRMGPIVGSIDSLTPKFVKELFVQRGDLQSTFARFVESNAKVFGLVGAAGVGKTNAICSIALEWVEKTFVFFYNAVMINKSPIEHIAQDLNVFFSSKSDSDLILKKLNELGLFLNKNILLFIDAIDESTSPHISIELSEIALSVRNFEKIKICISCKSSDWSSMLEINGTPTHLFEELRKFHYPLVALGNKPGYLIDNFSYEEMEDVVPMYQSTFGFEGDLSKSVIDDLRNGFFLRIFSTVYSNRKVPERINDRNLIRDYLQQSLEKANINIRTGFRILSEIGKILISHQYKSFFRFGDEGINYDTLLDKLNFPLEETLPEGLFSRNILITTNRKESYNISFYYSKIRDYIICYHSFRLHELSDDEFYTIVELFYQNHIGESAISFYLDNAKESHKFVLAKFKRNKAIAYVSIYDSYLEENFKAFKQLFVPRTDGEIGIVFPINPKRDGYALYPLKSKSDQKIIYENLDNPFSNSYYDSRMFEIGVDTVHGSHSALLGPSQEKLAKKEIFKQLKKIIENGRISAYNSDILLMEQVSAIIYYYSAKLGFDTKRADFYFPRFDAIYPLDMLDVLTRVRRIRAIYYYERQGVSSKDLNTLVENALQNNVDFPRLNIVGDFPPFEELSKIVTILLKRGYRYFDKHHLPYPDRSIQESKKHLQRQPKNEISDTINSQFSTVQTKVYIECFFRHLERSYKEFVEFNFPKLKNGFNFYISMPHEYFFYMRESENSRWGQYAYRNSKDGQIKFHHKEYEPDKDVFEEDDVKVLYGFSFDSLIRVDYRNLVKTIDRLNTPKLDESCVIRSWIYKILKDDMRKMFKEHDESI